MNMSLSTFAMAIFAIGLIIPNAISTTEFIHRPSWYRASSFLALMLVTVGYASTLFLSYHIEDHRAYMVAFVTSTFGACCLVIASITNLQRLLLPLRITHENRINVFKLSPGSVVRLLGLMQIASVAALALGCIYLARVHDRATIEGVADVLYRIQSQERSTALTLTAYILQTMTLAVIMVALLGVWRYVPSRKALHGITVLAEEITLKKLTRTAFYTMAATSISILIRTVYHLIEFSMTDPEGLEVATISTLGFYFDLAPVFCACWTVLYQSTSLNQADEITERSQLRRLMAEKDTSAC